MEESNTPIEPQQPQEETADEGTVTYYNVRLGNVPVGRYTIPASGAETFERNAENIGATWESKDAVGASPERLAVQTIAPQTQQQEQNYPEPPPTLEWKPSHLEKAKQAASDVITLSEKATMDLRDKAEGNGEDLQAIDKARREIIQHPFGLVGTLSRQKASPVDYSSLVRIVGGENFPPGITRGPNLPTERADRAAALFLAGCFRENPDDPAARKLLYRFMVAYACAEAVSRREGKPVTFSDAYLVGNEYQRQLSTAPSFRDPNVSDVISGVAFELMMSTQFVDAPDGPLSTIRGLEEKYTDRLAPQRMDVQRDIIDRAYTPPLGHSRRPRR